jgi:hypothetical protein
MSKTIYSTIYREVQKMRFLKAKNYEESTIGTIKTFFRMVGRVEYDYDKDLVEFSQEEVIDMFKSINTRSRITIISMCTFFREYYDWCLQEGIITNNDNKFDLSKTPIYANLVVPDEVLEEQYFTRKVLKEKYVKNVIDIGNKFLLYALFCGVKGEGNEELVCLRLRDLDEENKKLTLVTGRIIEVDDFFIQLMKEADSAKYYDQAGDLQSRNTRYDWSYEYVESQYVFKYMARGVANQPISEHMLKSRFAVIRKQSGNKALSMNTIYKNGLINYLKEKFEEQGISLEEGLTKKYGRHAHVFGKTTEQYIEEFGSKTTLRALKMEIKDFFHCFQD